MVAEPSLAQTPKLHMAKCKLILQVCNDFFDNEAATVACRQLGFKGRGHVLPSDMMKTGDVSGPILLDDVKCIGNETSLDDCKHSAWGVHNW